MDSRRNKVAVVGAGIAGLTCALKLSEHHDVEIFEACARNGQSRPLQMEGALHYLDNIPDLEPTYNITDIILSSENERATFQGDIGHLFMIGGKNGLDAAFRKEASRRVEIRHSTRITNLDMLSDYDIIVAADGYRSRVALMAGMREEKADLSGIGIGLTIEGNFETGTTFSLFDNNYAPGGYLYLIPISEHRASLVSASIGNGIPVSAIRERLRDYARNKGFKVLEEWTDIEKWYRFKTYQKDNIYVIGGAASFTDKTYGFGLKYSIQSATLCAEAIMKHKSYQKMLAPVLKELSFWERIGAVLVNTSNEEKDIFVRLAKNRVIRRRIEKGKTIRPVFRSLVRYYNFRHRVPARRHVMSGPTPVKT